MLVNICFLFLSVRSLRVLLTVSIAVTFQRVSDEIRRNLEQSDDAREDLCKTMFENIFKIMKSWCCQEFKTRGKITWQNRFRN